MRGCPRSRPQIPLPCRAARYLGPFFRRTAHRAHSLLMSDARASTLKSLRSSASYQTKNGADCSVFCLVRTKGLAPLAARPGAQPTGLMRFAFLPVFLLLRHANRSLYFGLRPRAPWQRNTAASRYSLLMSAARASTLKSLRSSASYQAKNGADCSVFCLVRTKGLEPPWSPTGT